MMHAAFLVDWGWHVRGMGWSKNVPPESWEHFRRCLTEAHGELTRAWTLSHSEILVPMVMLSICVAGSFSMV